MFRKLVSSLPFSPALVGQLGFYARRLQKEQTTRRLGLIFTVLALVVQAFAVFSPSEQATASSASAIVPGGVSSVDQILQVYDTSAAGKNDFKDLMDYFGVTRDELRNMDQKVTYICSSDHSMISFGREHHYSAAEGELTHHIPTSSGNFSTFYSVPLYRFDEVNHQTNCYDSFVGQSAKIGWFAIMRKCGNFQIKQDVRRIPRGHFVSASCTSIQGFAYDERQQDQPVKVYLFFNGPPGKGTPYGPIIADSTKPTSPVGGGSGFVFSVPDTYQSASSPTTVWAVMQPLAGWTDATVQFDNTVQVPNNCKVEKMPIATCDSLKVNLIQRTKFSFTANASVAQGATVKGYEYVITDKNSKTVFSKFYPSAQPSNTSEPIDLRDIGPYKAKVIVKASTGDQQSGNCAKTFAVAATDKCPLNPSIGKNDGDCKSCPYDNRIWVKDNDCAPKITLSKEAKNLTQNGKSAKSTAAQPGDRIQYDLHTGNLGDIKTTTIIQENIGDALEYATLVDAGGGTYDATAKTISWGTTAIDAGKTDTRSIVIQINDTIAGTPRAANDPAAYDCVITNSYGNTINIPMSCPLGKTIEGDVKQLPATGPGENMIFASITLMIVTYFYARSRQMSREMKIIRRDFNVGPM